MRIGIDMSSLSDDKTGVGYYAVNLVKAIGKADSSNMYFLYIREKYFQCFSDLGSNFTRKIIPDSRRYNLPKTQISLAYSIWKDKLDLFYSPAFFIPFICLCRSVITIHDLTHVVFPEKQMKKHLFVFNSLLPYSIKRSSRIVADSMNTKKDIIRVFKVPEEKIRVVYAAAGDSFRPIKDEKAIARIKQKYGISSDYILFVGTIEPRKNIISLIQAYSLLKKNKPVDYKLVIVGKKGWMYSEVFNTVKELNLSEEIIFTYYTPEEDMVGLYNGAKVFVYPSLYEGFGLPPLEAMACGVPVITSNVSSLPEVVGDAAIMVNPADINQLAESISRVINDEELRRKMIERGLERARMFSWGKTAKEIIECFKE